MPNQAEKLMGDGHEGGENKIDRELQRMAAGETAGSAAVERTVEEPVGDYMSRDYDFYQNVYDQMDWSPQEL